MRLYKGYIDTANFQNVVYWKGLYYLHSENVFWLIKNDGCEIIGDPELNERLKFLNTLVYDKTDFEFDPYKNTINGEPRIGNYVLNNQHAPCSRPNYKTGVSFVFDDTVYVRRAGKLVILGNKKIVCNNALHTGGCLSWKKLNSIYYSRGIDITGITPETYKIICNVETFPVF